MMKNSTTSNMNSSKKSVTTTTCGQGRQNGGAKARALEGPAKDSGSELHRQRLADEQRKKRQDNKNMKVSQKEADKLFKLEQKKAFAELDRKNAQAAARAGFLSEQRYVDKPKSKP